MLEPQTWRGYSFARKPVDMCACTGRAYLHSDRLERSEYLSCKRVADTPLLGAPHMAVDSASTASVLLRWMGRPRRPRSSPAAATSITTQTGGLLLLGWAGRPGPRLRPERCPSGRPTRGKDVRSTSHTDRASAGCAKAARTQAAWSVAALASPRSAMPGAWPGHTEAPRARCTALAALSLGSAVQCRGVCVSFSDYRDIMSVHPIIEVGTFLSVSTTHPGSSYYLDK